MCRNPLFGELWYPARRRPVEEGLLISAWVLVLLLSGWLAFLTPTYVGMHHPSVTRLECDILLPAISLTL